MWCVAPIREQTRTRAKNVICEMTVLAPKSDKYNSSQLQPQESLQLQPQETDENADNIQIAAHGSWAQAQANRMWW